MQMIAIKQNEYTIQYIKKPTKRVQLEAVKSNGFVIEYIKNPFEDLKKVSKEIEKVWRQIQQIKNLII